jgi:hypothetical protein
VTTPDHRPAIYAESGANYRAMDDLRLRLLALLPLATGTGIFLLLKPDPSPSARLTVPAGIFGVLATISLFFYELHGIEKCAHFIHRGQQIEKELNIRGSFTNRPHEVFGVVSEFLPAKVIYPASLAGWAMVATASLTGSIHGLRVSYLIALATGLIGVVSAAFVIRLRERARPAEWEEEDDLFAKGIWTESGVLRRGGGSGIGKR